MQILLGIDLGTSGIKAMLLDADQGVVATETKKYDVMIPAANCAEQNPDTWWDAAMELLGRLRCHYREAFDQICGIGLSGQMHGLVMVDQSGKPLRPSIIWLDQRSCAEAGSISRMIPEEEKKSVLHNRIYPGFALPSLLWVKKNEPEQYRRIYRIMQPKDYIRFQLTGTMGTDMSDASATSMFHVGERRWAWELIERLGIRTDIFTECRESMDIAGLVTCECAKLTGLKPGIPVIYGCGDQIAQSVGNGIVSEGDIVSNIGTGGQISTYSTKDIYDEELRTHTFCHALNQAYTVFGATLCSGLSLKWLSNEILDIKDFDQCNRLAAQVPAGSDGMIYLPYLSGERTPIMDAHAKGMFFGLKLEHDKRFFIRSVMEGIIFSLKDSLALLEDMGIQSGTIIASGGGSVSEVLLQIQADIFEKEIRVCSVKEQACLGACILAGAGTGVFKDVESACSRFVTFNDMVYRPNPDTTEVYRKNYEVFHRLYQNTKELM